MRKVAVFFINLYQHTLSPDHGPLRHILAHGVCRFEPSCSEYTKQAIQKYGTIKGSAKGFWRILRCNPFNQGGYDPVK